MNSRLYECHVMHARFAPRAHRFVYKLFLFAIDLDELPLLQRTLRFFSVGRRNLYSFRESDYFPISEPLHNQSKPKEAAAPHHPAVTLSSTLKERVVATLQRHGIDLQGGRVELITLPRVAGYLFNPVSFYFCYDKSNTPVAAIPEVTNTFREMKPYVLGPETRRRDGSFHLRLPKHFYVSPFSDVDVSFDFQLSVPADRLGIQIDDYVDGTRTLTSTLTGPSRSLTDRRLVWFTFLYPLITLRIIGLIHWHALLLYFKRIPWFRKGARPADQRDLYRPHGAPLQPNPSDA